MLKLTLAATEAKGVIGRYNRVGEWKPFSTEGDHSGIERRVWELTREPDLFGPLFYILFTGYSVVEFLAQTSIDLPTEEMVLANGRLNLWKYSQPKLGDNRIVYDGAVDLGLPADQIQAENVRAALRLIGVVLNRLAFTYRATVEWKPKYTQFDPLGSFATPSEADLELFTAFLSPRWSEAEELVLDAAVDWYNRAVSATNLFNRFLGYYIVVESTATAIVDERASFHLDLAREPKIVRRQARRPCIEELYRSLYADNPELFVRRSYDECLQNLKQQTKSVATLVFGEGHSFLVDLFVGSDEKPALSDIRAGIAHGRYSLMNPEDVAIVRGRIGKMSQIARGLLSRLMLGLMPGEEVPTWSGTHKAGISFQESGGLWSVDPVTLANQDWSMRLM